MTNLQALKARVNYPLSDAQATEKLIGRGIVPAGEYDATVAASRGFMLAYADTLRFVVTMVNLSQSGSITAQATAEIRATANAIYREYDELPIGEEQSVIRDISYRW